MVATETGPTAAPKSDPKGPGAAQAQRRPPEADSTEWQSIAERGSIYGLRLTVWCYRVFGHRISLGLIYAVVSYFFVTDPAGRRASLAYLRRMQRFHRERGEAAAKSTSLRDSYRHYRNFALAITDRLAIWFARTDDFEFETHGTERFDELKEEGRGALIVGAHLGSFDALRMLAKRTNITVHALMFTDNARLINTIFREISPESEARLITVEPGSVQSVFEIRECLRRGEHVAILADRVEPTEKRRTRPVSVLGDPVALPEAPFLLACLLRCPLVFMVALREARGHYRVHADVLSEGTHVSPAGRPEAIEMLAGAYAERLEHYCSAAPDQWFNFYDYWGDAEGEKGQRDS